MKQNIGKVWILLVSISLLQAQTPSFQFLAARTIAADILNCVQLRLQQLQPRVPSNVYDLVYFLVKHGNDINEALRTAHTKNNIDYIIDLDQAGAAIDGAPILVYVLEKKDDKLAKILIEKNVNINTATQYGTTPLIISLLRNQLDIAKSLIESGADINAQNKDGDFALGLAVYNGYNEIIRLLLKRNAQLNLQDSLGHTPLMLAIVNSDQETVKLLLEAGARLDIEDNFGSKAVDYARESTPEIRALLQEYSNK